LIILTWISRWKKLNLFLNNTTRMVTFLLSNSPNCSIPKLLGTRFVFHFSLFKVVLFSCFSICLRLFFQEIGYINSTQILFFLSKKKWVLLIYYGAKFVPLIHSWLFKLNTNLMFNIYGGPIPCLIRGVIWVLTLNWLYLDTA